MTIAEQIKKMLLALAAWQKGNGGSVKVANDEPHLFQLLGVNPGAPRGAILFDDELPRDEKDDDWSGRVDRKFIIAISRGRGFKLDQGKSLTEGVAGGDPMFVLVEEAREILRALRFDDVTGEPLPRYHGTRRLQFQGVTNDAYAITISIAAQIPDQIDYDQ
jgi:hypothetical protein